ncbi:MAG: response regulator [Planctomycetes bacterium]|nr:response regulator [Planctomycetota bacterium]
MSTIQGEAADVLLVENSPAEARLLAEAIAGCEPPIRQVLAMNGEDALDYLRRKGNYASAKRPRLILLDLNLPRKDGREVLEDIKDDPELKHIPVVVLTTSAAESDVRRSYRSHANCFITKPAELPEYRTVVRSLVDFWLRIARLPAE